MAKIVLPEITSGYLATDKLNEAFGLIETAFENTLSRDGTTPNQLEADLDLNGYALLNSASESTDPNRVLTYTEMVDYVTGASSGLVSQTMELQTATAAQTVFNLTTMEYNAGSNSLAVYVNGVRKFTPTDYTETDSDTVTFAAGLTAGDKVQFIKNDFLGTVSLPTHTHTWAQITNVPVFTTRWPDWTEVTGKPSTFAPEAHAHNTADITSGTGLADGRRGVWVQASQPTAGRVGELWIW